MQIRPLNLEEISIRLFRSFCRRQEVTQCWRKENGAWQVRDVAFVDDWDAQDYAFLVQCLRRTVQTGGVVFGAFLDGALKGFARDSRAIPRSDKPACFAGTARSWHRPAIIPAGSGLGANTGRKKAVYLRAFRRGDAGILPGNGLCGGGGTAGYPL